MAWNRLFQPLPCGSPECCPCIIQSPAYLGMQSFPHSQMAATSPVLNLRGSNSVRIGIILIREKFEREIEDFLRGSTPMLAGAGTV